MRGLQCGRAREQAGGCEEPLPAEDVGVVLLEAPHAREAGQGAAELVAVQHAKVRVPQRQLPVRALAVPEHHAVPCTSVQESAQLQLASARGQSTSLIRYDEADGVYLFEDTANPKGSL